MLRTKIGVIAGTVAVAALATASAFTLANLRGNDLGDDPSWWQPLLAFAPAEATGGSVFLSNAEQIYDKEGLPKPGPCQTDAVHIVTDAEARAEASTRQFYPVLYLPEAGLGFDACQVRRYAGLSYGLQDAQVQVFDAGITEERVIESLLASGYAEERIPDLVVFAAPPRDTEGPYEALGIFDSIAYVTIVDEFVITSNNRDALVDATESHGQATTLGEEALGFITAIRRCVAYGRHGPRYLARIDSRLHIAPMQKKSVH